jgi:hypothetical protein
LLTEFVLQIHSGLEMLFEELTLQWRGELEDFSSDGITAAVRSQKSGSANKQRPEHNAALAAVGLR